MEIPTFISARSNDLFENSVVEAMLQSWPDEDKCELFLGMSEDHWSEVGWSHCFEAAARYV